MPLTGKGRHRLRALAHHLDPVVQIGKEGLTDAVLSQIDEALRAHELIKVRVGGECPIDREEAAELVASGARAEIAQVIGKVLVVFRRRVNAKAKKKSKIDLKAKRGDAAARAVRSKPSVGAHPIRRRKRAARRRVG